MESGGKGCRLWCQMSQVQILAPPWTSYMDWEESLSPNKKVSVYHFFFLGAENKIQKQKEVG